ncbi:MAG TPA: lytic transglycosylase domain-containing protein [Aeromicrobium sp.]|nr:lytic transglycosylase domain-containing protein [Aeromicrobium sp.]HKY56492.1 lytic transglycosylase domain-containing protein [Aeromicrobium sp.]
MTIDTQTRPPVETPTRRQRRRSGRRIAAIIAVPLILVILAAFGIVFRAVVTQHRALQVDAPPLALTPMATAAAPSSANSSGGAQVSGGPMVDPTWIQQTSAMTGIPPRALEGYGKAQLQISVMKPACRLGWNTLAGIGWIETGHGTTRGSTLLPDGRTSKLILGPALDGTKGTRAIKATAADHAATGDPEWDHAAGPMQFIGGTWARWGTDGNRDGIVDRNNIDDAALSAAMYLCAGGRDLSSGEGWSDAVHSYNHSNKYVLAVNKRANKYAMDALS